MSRIGKKPVAIPAGVTVEARDGQLFIEGPKGKLARPVHSRISFEIKDSQVSVKRAGNSKLDKSLHGLYRALTASMVKGVTEGYIRELEIQGTGFKAQMQGTKLVMHLGFSHPISFETPPGITIETPKPTQVVIRGINNEKVGEIAAEIRAVYPPEPYKGKGVRYSGEKVRKKVGKAQATGGGK